jgi:hypothetical protein
MWTTTWFVALAAVCLLGPYVLGVRPTSRRYWFYIGFTIVFVAWILLLMVSLRSR